MDATRRQIPLSRRSALWLLAGLSLLVPVSASAQTVVYYSVGTAGATDLKYGTPNVTIAGTTATFSSPQLNNIGVGDEITYAGNKAYISGRTSSTVYSVTNAAGGLPTPTGGVAVTSITRAFPTLTAAIAGSGNGTHLNDFNLTAAGGNFELNLAMYNDGPMNNGAINIDGYTTDATHYIRIFAPVAAGHVGSSQRHEGRAGTGFRLRPVMTPGATSEVIRITDDFVRIEGIEIDASRVTTTFDFAGIRVDSGLTAAADLRFDKLIIHDLTTAATGAAADLACMNYGSAGVRLSNSICYALHSNSSAGGTDIYGLRVSSSSTATLYLHNNTIYDIAALVTGPSNVHGISYAGGAPPNMTVRNTVVLNVTRVSGGSISCFQNAAGYVSASNNVSSDGTATGAGSQINRTAYATYFRSVVAGAEDLHLLKDSIAIWGSNGADLDADANLPVTDDVDGEARHATAPDIGADEFSTAPPLKMRVKSGKYQGTGSARFVYVGFQPDAVFVKRLEGPYGAGNEAADNAVLKTNTMAGNTKSLWRGGIALASEPDMVQSLNPTGFTVGTDVAVNEGPGPCGVSGCTYYWVAFKAAPGYMTVGSYSGNNATLRSITGIGFEPDYVIVLPEGSGDPAGTPVWASSTFPVGESYEFDARLRSPGAITGLESDAFQVGRGSGGTYTAPDLNASGTTYHYVAWNAVPGHTAVGTYLGNGAASRTLNVAGFYPAWVLIKKDDIDTVDPGERAVTHKTPATRNDESVGGLRFSEITPVTNTIKKLLPLGFEVGPDERINFASDTTCREDPGPSPFPCEYHWVAIGPHEPQINYRSIGTMADLSGPAGDGINVTAGSTTVTKSSGVGWLADKRGRGDVLTVGANDYQILRVDSDNQLTLATPAVANYSSNIYTIARQFDTLQEWENCISFNSDDVGGSDACTYFDVASASLVADDRSEVGIAYKDSVFTAGVRFNGPLSADNTDATHTITLTADPGNRHYGLPGTGVLIDNGGNPNPAITIWDDYVSVEWMEIEDGGATPWGIVVGNSRISPGTGVTGGSRIVLRNNLIHVPGFGISLDDFDVVADVYNNIIYQCSAGIRISETTSLRPWTQIRIFNNTIYNFGSGGIDSSVPATGLPQQITLINNIAADANVSAASFGLSSFPAASINGASRNNLSTNETTANNASPGGGAVVNVGISDNPALCSDGQGCVAFQSCQAEGGTDCTAGMGVFNLHLRSAVFANQAVNAGADLSSLFTFDIDFALRQTPWDIGADDMAATTAVTLQSFSAVPGDRSVVLEWRTASELRNLGFHVYRSLAENGPWTRLTSALIPGLGSSAVGQAYSFRDSDLTNDTRYFYRLEDVDASSKTTSHGPVSAVPSAGAGKVGEPSGGDKNDKKKASASSCPDWVLSAYASAVGSDAATTSLRCTRHGNPESVSLGELSRDARQATLELRTGGFYALHEPAGTVRVFVPGFDFPQDAKAAALPIRRILADAVVGRRVQLGGVRALELSSFALQPSALGRAEMQVGRDGTVRALRRGEARLAKRLPKAELVTLLPSLFQGEKKSAAIEIAPLRFDEQRRQLVLAKRVLVRLLFTGREAGESGRGNVGRAPGRKPVQSGEVLARLHTTGRGLYAVAFEQLFPGRSRGFASSELNLQRQGEAVAFHVEPAGSAFGPGGRLYFHADRTTSSTDYSGELAWELVHAQGGVPRTLQGAAPGSAAVTADSIVTRTFETNRLYQPGLLEAEDQWLWEPAASGATRVKSFTLSGVSTSGAATLEVYLQGASESGQAVDHHMSVSVNGTFVGEARFAGRKPYRMSLSLEASLLREGTNDLMLRNVGDTGITSVVFLDRFTLTHPQQSSLAAGVFEGSWSESGSATVGGVSAGAAVVDVTAAARWLTGYEATGGSVRFRAEAGHRYLVASQTLAPRVTLPQPSTLRAATNQADYVLIAPQAFLEAAQPLLDRRADQGLTTRAASLEEIAAEFGHGQASAEAIKSFLAHAFHSWARPSPRYVVLLGDASYDPRNFVGNSPPAPLPALWTKTSYLWTAADPLLAAVNGTDNLPDLAIGRLPATTVEQAESLVAKLLAWEDSGQGLDGAAALVADNPDIAGDFEADVEDIRASYLGSRQTTVLKLSELGAQTRPAILDALNSGLSYLNYVGHGGSAVWASENVWSSSDAPSLQAQSQQPLLVTMNCLNGYFVAPTFESLSESLIKAEGRGAIASFSPSGLSLDGPAHQYHRALMAELTSGRHARLGDATLAAQKAYAETGLMPELVSVYHLLGDPATAIR